jgi:hypothetical protein
MQARAWEMHGAAVLALADLKTVDAVEPDAVGLGAVGVEIGQRRRDAAGVPFLAVDRAGMAPDADVEIDDEAEPPCRGILRQARHDFAPARKRAP